jgi:hypothetical protein
MRHHYNWSYNLRVLVTVFRCSEMVLHSMNNTKASIPRHLRSPNIRAGDLLNVDQFPSHPFSLSYYELLWKDGKDYLSLQPHTQRGKWNTQWYSKWRENYKCDLYVWSVMYVCVIWSVVCVFMICGLCIWFWSPYHKERNFMYIEKCNIPLPLAFLWIVY